MRVLWIILLTAGLFGDTFEKAVSDYNEGNYIQALDAFYALAKEGDAKAQFNVGLIYAMGKGVNRDRYQAKEWYRKAADQGNSAAQYNLAKLLMEHSENRDSRMVKQAIYWYKKAAEGGEAEALNDLALLYLDGRGVEKNELKAFELLKKAARLGNSAAEVNVALIYAWGEAVPHDKMKAYKNLKQALSKGRTEASPYLEKLCKESSWACQN